MSNTNKPIDQNLQKIIKKIEIDINPKTMSEGLKLLNKPDALIGKLQEGVDMFKEQTGRNITYLEMRHMFG